MARFGLSKRTGASRATNWGYNQEMDALDATIAAFDSSLGWMAVVWSEGLVTRVTFGHRSRRSAIEASGHRPSQVEAETVLSRDQQSLVEQLTGYADGELPDFSGVHLDFGSRSAFAQRVLNQCRQIPWGHRITYGHLAARCGSPGAARAVGNVMANNPLPLIIPCHRVVGAAGALGGFSAPSGISMKRRLLGLESEMLMNV